MAIDFFWVGGGINLVRTLVPIVANCSKNPEVTNAAAGTFLHEGRIAAVHCILNQCLLQDFWHGGRPVPFQSLKISYSLYPKANSVTID